MGIALIALLMITGTLSLKEMVAAANRPWLWNIIYQPLGFLIFLVCAFAECNRTPFDLPEAENELMGVITRIFFHETWILFICGIYQYVFQRRSDGNLIFWWL